MRVRTRRCCLLCYSGTGSGGRPEGGKEGKEGDGSERSSELGLGLGGGEGEKN